MLGTLVNGVTALLFPMFASYRALVSNDISLIRPWLMYLVVFGSFQFTESIFRPITRLIPFYGLFRMGFLLYLVLPQTQGAVQLYQSKFEPWLSSHDAKVEAVVTRAVNFLHSSGYANILAMVGIHVPKPPPPPGQSGAAATAASGISSWWSGKGSAAGESEAGTMSITDSFMSRFRLTGNPDNNISAYLPALLKNTESTAVVRNSLLGMLRSIDSRAPNDVQREAAAKPELVRDTDEYDFVDTPQHTPQNTPPPRETEIEREVEASLRQEPQQARRRWV